MISLFIVFNCFLLTEKALRTIRIYFQLIKGISDLRRLVENAFGKRAKGYDLDTVFAGELYGGHHQLLTHAAALEFGVHLRVIDYHLVLTRPGTGHAAGFSAVFFGFEKAFRSVVNLCDFHFILL